MSTLTRIHPHTQQAEEAQDMQLVQVAIFMDKIQGSNIVVSRYARGAGVWKIWQTPDVEK